ncbi:MAG: YqgE/AlgH family protein [Rubripirellula sp.]
MKESFTGNLLVASSLVTDPMYAGGVCLVVHEDETSVIGVMLNRPIKPDPDALRAVLGDDNKPLKGPTNRLTPVAGDADETELDGEDLEISDSQFGNLPWRMLHFGGPLSGPVVAVHQVSKYAEAETGEGIYVAAQKQHLEDLLKRSTDNCRLIVGHLGWEPNQLEKEIAAGVWHLVPATVDDVFTSAKSMWPSIIRRATSRSLARWLGIPDVIAAGELN